MRRQYPRIAWERAMKVQEVILKAISGEFSWIRAAHILRMTARNLRRLKCRYEKGGYDGLLDRRMGRPSPKRAPLQEVEKVLRLYRETYQEWNVRHFHETVQREHGVRLSYTFVKKALQEAGLVKQRRKRGKHRLRRPRRACFGEMVHVDGSEHAWLAWVPEAKQVLIALADDATGRLLYAQLRAAETSRSILHGVWVVVRRYGIPMALYSDRAGWAFFTPKAGGKVDPETLTDVGRVLARLGIEHIPSYSPQARGRGERLNRTLQDRLINELRVAGIRTRKEANRYLRKVFIPCFNKRFARPPAKASNVFVSAGNVDLRQIFCFEATRKVAKDNTISYHRRVMQIAPQPGRATCSGVKVTVREHLDGTHSIWQGMRCFGNYDAEGKAMQLPEGEKTQSRPDLASAHAGENTRGKDRWLSFGPRSFLLRSKGEKKSTTGHFTCQKMRTS